MKGRPKFLNTEASLFLDYYFDPINSIDKIAALCGLKKSTIYNYEKELNSPKLKVALGTIKANLPKEKVLSSITDPDELYELNLIRKLGRELNMRIKIVPVLPYPYNVSAPLQLLETKDVDFVFSSYTKTKALNHQFYCSNEYFNDGGPSGVLFCNPRNGLAGINVVSAKPILAVLESSIHAEYALKNLQQEFTIRTFKSSNGAFASLQHGTSDFALFHHTWSRLFEDQDNFLKICSKPINYNTNSAIIFHADSQSLIPAVNSAIDKILSSSLHSVVS